MINAAKEFARTAGYAPLKNEYGVIADANQIVSGRYVKLSDNAGDTVVVPVLGTEAAADFLGIAADDTKPLGYNGLYEVIDNFFKYGKVAAFVGGGLFTVWNDGRGAVFAGEESGETGTVLEAVPGTPLYISDAGVLCTEAGTASTVGATVVASVIRAPKTVEGTLFFKAKGL